MTREHERSAARRMASQILYSGAIRNDSAISLLEDSCLDCLEAPVSDYAYRLVEGVEQNKPELDSRLAEISERWSLDRMPVMDLTILRLALFEMLYVDEVPISVSINEAVELAKSFGGEDDSHKFVNGMLGNVARQMLGEQETDANE